MLQAFVSKSISYVYQNLRWNLKKTIPKIILNVQKNVLFLPKAPSPPTQSVFSTHLLMWCRPLIPSIGPTPSNWRQNIHHNLVLVDSKDGKIDCKRFLIA